MDTSISSILGQFSTDFVNLNDEEECVTPFPELHDFDVFMRNFLGLLLTQKDNSFARFAPAFVNMYIFIFHIKVQ
jgi:hypothetical protein